MMIPILIVVIGLVAWALHLMQEAIEQREFSLMLAGSLVASSAAALVCVYFLMGNYMGYLTRVTGDSASNQEAYESVIRLINAQELEESQIYLSDSLTPTIRPRDRSVE